jgi:hypothetical protein
MVVGGDFVMASGDAPVLLDPVEELLKQVACSVDNGVNLAGQAASRTAPVPELRGTRPFEIARRPRPLDQASGPISSYAAFLKSPICASNARLKAGRAVQRST